MLRNIRSLQIYLLQREMAATQTEEEQVVQDTADKDADTKDHQEETRYKSFDDSKVGPDRKSVV